tara:strand:- start:325 stop:672 length:348 start_codon:yes stop_codon:yes gene_type:complete
MKKKKNLEKMMDYIERNYASKKMSHDGESVVYDCKHDLRRGIVMVHTDSSLATKIIKRCRNQIKDITIYEEGGLIDFTIDRSAFRGLEYAFKTGNERNRPRPTWLWDEKGEQDNE